MTKPPPPMCCHKCDTPANHDRGRPKFCARREGHSGGHRCGVCARAGVKV